MKTAELGDYFEWKGQIVKVEWLNGGFKAIGFYYQELVECPHCQKTHEVPVRESAIEASDYFQENAKPIQTIRQ